MITDGDMTLPETGAIVGTSMLISTALGLRHRLGIRANLITLHSILCLDYLIHKYDKQNKFKVSEENFTANAYCESST